MELNYKLKKEKVPHNEIGLMQFKTMQMGTPSVGVEEIFNILDNSGFALLINHMTDGVLIVNTDDIVCSINNAALKMNSVKKFDVLGGSLKELFATSSLDWDKFEKQNNTKLRQEFVTSKDDGRSILVSVRLIRDSTGNVAYIFIIMRDLKLFDHMRRTATGVSGGNVFKFLSDREISPDFETQRHFSEDVNRMIVCGTRAMHQGVRLLLTGESGSGKTELAKYLHRSLGTPEEPFVHINCGAIPETLFESEMFGYEKGAFTGSVQNGKRGLIESADGGTLLLDEIGEVPLSLQAKLLKFLDDGVVQRIGGRTGKKINTRIISATNHDLWQMVCEKRFRQDLYYRLAVITLEVSPLRKQPELINHLINHFVTAANRMRKPHLKISEICRSYLTSHSFPGNIRELHNLIQHLSVLADEEALADHLPKYVLQQGDKKEDYITSVLTPMDQEEELVNESFSVLTRPLKEQVREFERALIDTAIERLGSKRKAAHALGVNIGTIVRKTQEVLIHS
jgi:PAS domain S-box-containing protein